MTALARAALPLLVACLSAAPAAAQADRREQVKSPGLVVDTGAPSGSTNSLAFSADGKFLLAGGEDKVVRQWPLRAKGTLDRDARTTFRWRTWHEWRGAVYVTALSPDAAQKYLAVGGYGAVLGEVAVIDRATGKTVAALTKPKGFADLSAVTTAVAFHPTADALAIGTDAGGIFLWEFARKEPTVVRVGAHGPRKGWPTNQISHLSFHGGRLVSAAEDGLVRSWPLDGGGRPTELTATTVPNADVVASCPARQLLAFGGRDDAKANAVEVRSLDGKTSARLTLPDRALARALAFSGDGRTLAVAVELPAEDGKPHSPQPAQVWVCDVTADAVTRRDVYPLDYHADAVALTPDGATLAVAGGSDFAIRLIDVKAKKQTDIVRGSGLPLWGVAFNADATALGIRTKRKNAPTGYNDWGDGDWRAFDLKGRRWLADAKFAPVAPLETLDGWAVVADSPRRWSVANAGLGKRYELPLIYSQDKRPHCFTFVKAAGGGVNLAVGHAWGYSLFAVTADGVRRIRLGYGHGSPVVAIAPSADHKLLLTAGRDQTVSCFSLKEWAHERELGATFVRDGAKFLVDQVADGSPAWEAGLSPGDEVTFLAVANADVKPEDWAARLQAPEPNKELYLEVRRRGIAAPFAVLTTVRQRPLWKFFALEKDEWVLWRWRDYFYDCSTNGDAAIGWQVNGGAGETPAFYKAEQMRKNRHKPEKVGEVLAAALVAPERTAVFDLLPPGVEVSADTSVPADRPLPVTVRLTPAADGPTRQPQSVSLWVNDHRVRTWGAEELGPTGLTKTVALPRSVLRADTPNVLVAHAYDKQAEASRGVSPPLVLGGSPAAPAAKLHGLFVGVADYTRTAHRGTIPNLLYSVKDAEAVRAAWQKQTAAGRWAAGRFALLADAEATPAAVVKQLREIARTAAADDLLVVHLSGHGWGGPRNAAGKYGREVFAFVGPTFDVRNYQETGLSSEMLYDELAAVPCRKLLLLDACHSGGAVTDEVRALTPEGIGPPILTAARPDEVAFEHPAYGQSLFSKAVVDALTRDFAAADRDGDGRLDHAELGGYTGRRVPELLARIKPLLPEAAQGRTQQPQAFPPPFRGPPGALRPVAWRPDPK